ncbi:hypothetical protein MRX96_014787 [Rhipicephalus microplus]
MCIVFRVLLVPKSSLLLPICVQCGDDDGGSRRSSEGGRRKRRRRRRLLSAGPCCSERPTSTTTAGAAAMLLNEPSTMNTVTGARNANGTSQGVSDAGSVAKEQGEQGAEHLLLGPLVDVPR